MPNYPLQAPSMHLHLVLTCFPVATEELSRCHRSWMAHKADSNICHLALCRVCLLSPDLGCKPPEGRDRLCLDTQSLVVFLTQQMCNSDLNNFSCGSVLLTPMLEF